MTRGVVLRVTLDVYTTYMLDFYHEENGLMDFPVLINRTSYWYLYKFFYTVVAQNDPLLKNTEDNYKWLNVQLPNEKITWILSDYATQQTHPFFAPHPPNLSDKYTCMTLRAIDSDPNKWSVREAYYLAAVGIGLNENTFQNVLWDVYQLPTGGFLLQPLISNLDGDTPNLYVKVWTTNGRYDTPSKNINVANTPYKGWLIRKYNNWTNLYVGRFIIPCWWVILTYFKWIIAECKSSAVGESIGMPTLMFYLSDSFNKHSGKYGEIGFHYTNSDNPQFGTLYGNTIPGMYSVPSYDYLQINMSEPCGYLLDKQKFANSEYTVGSNIMSYSYYQDKNRFYIHGRGNWLCPYIPRTESIYTVINQKGIMMKSNNNTWNITGILNYNVSSFETLPVSTSSYDSYLLSVRNQQNAQLVAAEKQLQFGIGSAILTGIGGLGRGIGKIFEGNVVGGATGSLTGLAGGIMGILQAKEQYDNTKRQIDAQNADKLASATAVNFASTDIQNNIYNMMSCYYQTNAETRFDNNDWRKLMRIPVKGWTNSSTISQLNTLIWTAGYYINKRLRATDYLYRNSTEYGWGIPYDTDPTSPFIYWDINVEFEYVKQYFNNLNLELIGAIHMIANAPVRFWKQHVDYKAILQQNLNGILKGAKTYEKVKDANIIDPINIRG